MGGSRLAKMQILHSRALKEVLSRRLRYGNFFSDHNRALQSTICSTVCVEQNIYLSRCFYFFVRFTTRKFCLQQSRPRLLRWATGPSRHSCQQTYFYFRTRHPGPTPAPPAPRAQSACPSRGSRTRQLRRPVGRVFRGLSGDFSCDFSSSRVLGGHIL